MRVFCDFDGTITLADTTDKVLAELAHPDWEIIEAQWKDGLITAAQCMSRQIALLKPDDAALNQLLDSLDLRPGFIEFTAWCKKNAVPLVIVSDGIGAFIHRILNRFGLDDLPVYANTLIRHGEKFELDHPHRRDGCAAGSGVCKCSIVTTPVNSYKTVFIGDGRSDFCASGRADLLLARDALAKYAEHRGQAYVPFDTFFDVTQTLQCHLRQPVFA